VSFLDENAPDEQRLLSALLSRYEPASRPVHNASDAVSVQFGLTLAQISDMVCKAAVSFLANVNSCSCSLYVVVRPSVCRLSSVCRL